MKYDTWTEWNDIIPPKGSHKWFEIVIVNNFKYFECSKCNLILNEYYIYSSTSMVNGGIIYHYGWIYKKVDGILEDEYPLSCNEYLMMQALE